MVKKKGEGLFNRDATCFDDYNYEYINEQVMPSVEDKRNEEQLLKMEEEKSKQMEQEQQEKKKKEEQ